MSNKERLIRDGVRYTSEELAALRDKARAEFDQDIEGNTYVIEAVTLILGDAK